MLVWLLWGSGLGAAAQYGKVSVVFDQLPQVYPGAGTVLGWAVSLVGFLGILFGVVAGVIVAKLGFRRALLAGLVVGAAVSLAQAFVLPLPVFLVSRVLEGAAHLAIVVAAPTMIAQICTDRDRGVALTLWGSFFGVAFAVLGWVGLPVVQRFGVPVLWLAHGMFMGAMALILWRKLPTLVPEARGPGPGEFIAAHLRIYRSPSIGAPAFGWLFYTMCFLSVLTLYPQFVDAPWRTFTVGAMPLLSIVSSLTLGVFILRRFGAMPTIYLGFGLCVFLAAAMALMPGSVALGLAMGAALGLVQGATFASVPELIGPIEDRALSNGGMAQMGNLGNTIGTPIMLWTLAVSGFTGMMLALMVLFAAGVMLHLWLAALRR